MNSFYKISIIYISIITSISAQKHDFNWLFGYLDGPKRDSVFGHSMMTFNTQSGNPEIRFDKSKNIDLLTGNTPCISDFQGNYLFSFNGFELQDTKGKKVPISDSICYWLGDCYAFLQQSLIIPAPGSLNEFYIINIHDYDIVYNSIPELVGGNISYSKILVQNTDHIIVDRFAQVIKKDTFEAQKIIGCKHANGRDWWIIIPMPFINSYYKLLLTPNKIISYGEQITNQLDRIYGLGIAFFSPNGEYYCNVYTNRDGDYPISFLDFYHFDRCTGLLSNHQRKIFADRGYIPNSGNEPIVISSGAFSPDNKVLYVCENDSIMQYSISEAGTISEKLLIDVYDGFRSHLFNNITRPTFISELQLAPDGRIYGNSSYFDTRELHVINYPNKMGKNCDFAQHSIRLPAIKYNMPNFPNYRLGPIDGSECDTLGIDNVPWAWWRYDQDTARYRCFEFVDLSAYTPDESEPEWYWDFGDGTQSRDTSPIHCFEKDGIYEVCLIVKNKYGADTLCRTLNVGTLATNDKGKIVIKTDIFPNPASDHFVLNIHDYLPESMYIHLINSQGQTVLSERVYQGSNVIDTEQLPAGLYSVVLYERGVVMKTEKIVIIR